MESWGLRSILHFIGNARKAMLGPLSLKSWSPLSIGSFKVNFDGASKGNPRLARYGGVVRDLKGNIQGLFLGFVGKYTNNIAEA